MHLAAGEMLRADSGEITAKSVSVSSVLESSAIGEAFFDAKRKQVIFELARPALESGPMYTPFLGEAGRLDARTALYVAPLERDGDSRLLFPHERGVGYSLANQASGLSPNGDKIAIFQIYNGDVKPAVFDMETEEYRSFDVEVRYENHDGVSLIWLNNEELIVLSESDPEDMRFLTTHGTRQILKQTEAEKLSWTNQATTVSVIGAGKYLKETHRLAPQVLLRLNTDTGKVSSILQGAIYEFSVSADRNFVAAVMVAEARPPKPDTAISYQEPFAYRLELAVHDLRLGTKETISVPGYTLERRSLSWAPVGSKLAFSVGVDGVVDPRTSQLVFDASRRSLHILTCDHEPSLREYSLQMLPPALGTSLHWVGGQDIALKCDSDRSVIATSSEWLFYIYDNAVWRTNDKSVREKVYQPEEGKLSLSEECRGIGRYPLPDIAGCPIRIEIEKAVAYIYLSESGNGVQVFSIPESEFFELKSVSPEGTVFVSFDKVYGGRLKYRSQNSVDEDFVLYEFNQHLVNHSGAVGPIPVHHFGNNGAKLTSWLHLPPWANEKKETEYPLVVVPYAGTDYTHGYRGDTLWTTDPTVPTSTQIFAARGYAVLSPSIPLNEAPSDPLSDLMPPLMAAVHSAIDTGFIDHERIAISGHSYGGYTALAAAVQSNRFRAVIASATGGVNLTSKYGVFPTGIRYQPQALRGNAFEGWSELGQGRMGSPPWRDFDRYRRNSVLFRADEITAPVMLIHGSADMLPIHQSEELFSAMLRQDKDVLFVRYWGEGHAIHNPHNQRDMWNRVFNFLEDNGVGPAQQTADR